LANTVIQNGKVIDGTGIPTTKTDIFISGRRIVESNINPSSSWDASGKVICPGFIDIHSHADYPIYVDGLAQSGIRQGLTTLVTGNCGHGPAPTQDKELTKIITIGFNENWDIGLPWNTFDDYLKALFSPGQSMNIAPLVSHGAVRLMAMGFDARYPTGTELAKMKSLVAEAMSAGAIGMSTGLEYSPGQHSNEAELIALAEVSASYGGCYASHIRNRGDNFEESVREALNIGLKANLPIQLSHLAPRPYAHPDAFDRVLNMINVARGNGQKIGIDTFPDPWGPAHLTDLLPPWVHEGSKTEVADRLQNPTTAEQCREYIEHPTNFLLRLGSFNNFYLTQSKANPKLVGLSIEEISRILELDHTKTILRLAADEGEDFSGTLIRHIFATQHDLEKLLMDPYCSIGSDGVVSSTEGLLDSLQMNRSSFGYAPRFIKEYSIDKKMFTLDEAIRKMTSLPATSVQLLDRGTLLPGMSADLVIIDLDKLQDNSTDQSPKAYPSGIEMVMVNGEIVFDDTMHNQKTPGELVKITSNSSH